MINIPFFSKPSTDYLGIDIGTSSIKVVEISGNKDITLKNYGEVTLKDFLGKSTKKKGNLLYSSEEIAGALKELLSEAGIDRKKAYFSLPDFVSFFTPLTLPPMKEEEIDSVVEHHSRQYIPLPSSEVALDWFLSEKFEEGKKIKVNLIAIPNDIIEEYQEIAELAGIDITALEGEMLSLSRAFARGKEGMISVIDIGEQSTLLSIIEDGILKTTHSLEIAGNAFFNQIAKKAEIDYNEAREALSIHGVKEEVIKKAIYSSSDSLFSEISRILNSYEKKSKKEINEIIIAGGMSLVPGMIDYAKESLDREVKVENCFQGIKYPETLEKDIVRLSQSHGIALGVALNGTMK